MFTSFLLPPSYLQVAPYYQRKEVPLHDFLSHPLLFHPSPLQTKEAKD